ncbi:MAG: FAD-binding oxidoreductase [Saprospiraceae bacterium]
MPVKWFDTEVVRIYSVSDDLRIFYLKVDSEEPFTFKSGQFVTMDLPVSDKRLHRWKSYSISNIPNEENIIEFSISLYPTGLGTKYLFEEVKVGSHIKIKGPDGGFTLPDYLDKEYIFLCTGTGVAPFRSMLLNIFENNLNFKHIHLIYGTRYSKNILYEDDFKRMTKENPNFEYDICLSREQHLEKYHPGHIHSIYLEKYKEKSDNRMFYMCGWSQMIDQAVLHLYTDLKYNRTQLVYELYG